VDSSPPPRMCQCAFATVQAHSNLLPSYRSKDALFGGTTHRARFLVPPVPRRSGADRGRALPAPDGGHRGARRAPSDVGERFDARRAIAMLPAPPARRLRRDAPSVARGGGPRRLVPRVRRQRQSATSLRIKRPQPRTHGTAGGIRLPGRR